MKAAPIITIGLPVFNGQEEIENTLKNISGQTFGDFLVLISDNASDDETSGICRSFCSIDPRFKYIRQTENIGAEGNFIFLTQKISSKYFVWLANGDTWSNNFLENNITFLEKNPDYVASVSKSKFLDLRVKSDNMGDEPKTISDAGDRILSFFNGFHANSSFYAVYRSSTINNLDLKNASFLGWDWLVVLSALLKGKINRDETSSLGLAPSGQSDERKIFKSYRTKKVEYFLPFYVFSRSVFELTRQLTPRHRLKIAYKLINLNLRANYQRAHTQAYIFTKLIAHNVKNRK